MEVDKGDTMKLSKNGSGGGGASDNRIGGTSLDNRILVAGGGGSGYTGSGGRRWNYRGKWL